jgi:cytochrome b translational activator protein CBS2
MRICLQCARARREAGHRAARHYGTVASAGSRSQRRDRIPEGDVLPLPRVWSKSAAATNISPGRSRYTPTAATPSVLVPADTAKSGSSHKIHILGDDARSKFIAHALSGVYASVELMGYSESSQRYSNIQFSARPRNLKSTPYVIPNPVKSRLLLEKEQQEDKSRIDHLVLTGNGQNVMKSLGDVKHRVDKDTIICLLGDGLGVLEDVKKKIFTPTQPSPNFMLGHMTHKIQFNRDTDSARLLKDGELWLTNVDKRHKLGTNFVETVRRSKELHTQTDSFDIWLRHKLPEVIFGAVVEPACVAFDMSYGSLRSDAAARRLMKQLLEEIVMALEDFPELGTSAFVRDFFRRESIELVLHRFINARQRAPSEMLTQVRRGLPMNVDFLTGYFVERANKLGIGLRMNRLMWDMVKAKHSGVMEQLNSYIPIEETSIPSHMAYRYRTNPQTRLQRPWGT